MATETNAGPLSEDAKPDDEDGLPPMCAPEASATSVKISASHAHGMSSQSGDFPQVASDESPPMEDMPSAFSSESYLAVARRAAAAAASQKEAVHRAESPRQTRSARVFLLACAAPVVIVAATIMVLNRHSVTAGTIPVAAAPAPAQIAAQISPPAKAVEIPPPEAIPLPPAAPPPAPMAVSVPLDELMEKAKSGDTKAERDIGLKYLAGDGIAIDDSEAARWLLSAAYKGEATAEYWLGTLYARGLGLPADPSQANHWYASAAKQGNLRAMHSLAVANFEGLGMEKNPTEAAKWFQSAAERGFADSQYNLAVLYERGTGVPKNLTEAYKWYALAAAQGDKEANARIAVLVKQMVPADLTAARNTAAAFKPLPRDENANAAALAPAG